MNNITTKAKEINQQIKETELIKRYNKLAKQIEENSDIKDLENNLNNLKHQLCKELDSNIDIKKQEVLEQYNLIKKELDENVIYQEYQELKDEVSNFLKQINDILNNL